MRYMALVVIGQVLMVILAAPAVEWLRVMPSRPDGFSPHSKCAAVWTKPDSGCPRFLVADRSAGAGFGHQIQEVLFAMHAAQVYNFSYVHTPFTKSLHHEGSHAKASDFLGLTAIMTCLGMLSVSDLNSTTLTHFNAGCDKDLQSLNASCNVVAKLSGYKHCSHVDGDCFKAATSAMLFQKFASCLQQGPESSPAAHTCILDMLSGQFNATRPVVIVIHVRFGDIITHPHNDPFFKAILSTVRYIADGFNPVITLVGGGSADPDMISMNRYHAAVKGVVREIWDANTASNVFVIREPLEISLAVMMQADILIGSGSSLPQIAGLFSDKPLFLNHESKHGFNFGGEVLSSHVDVAPNGTILDSVRRVRIDFLRRVARRPKWDRCSTPPPRL